MTASNQKEFTSVKGNHVQCLLKKGNIAQTAWLPQKYAILGKVLRLKDDNGWKVTKTWGTSLSRIILQRERAYQNQRKVSDI